MFGRPCSRWTRSRLCSILPRKCYRGRSFRGQYTVTKLVRAMISTISDPASTNEDDIEDAVKFIRHSANVGRSTILVGARVIATYRPISVDNATTCHTVLAIQYSPSPHVTASFPRRQREVIFDKGKRCCKGIPCAIRRRHYRRPERLEQ
jgi:hypothetical protein